MDEFSWLDGDDYNAELDLDMFDAYLASEWIDSFELPCSSDAGSGNVTTGDETDHFYEYGLTNLYFVSHQVNIAANFDRAPDANHQLDSILAPTPLQHVPTTVQAAFNGSPGPTTPPSFEQCLSEFVVTVPVDDGTRCRRKRYSSEKRKKVGQVRKAGACLRCRLMKTRVSHPENDPAENEC
jgi:hypothetical protein